VPVGVCEGARDKGRAQGPPFPPLSCSGGVGAGADVPHGRAGRLREEQRGPRYARGRDVAHSVAEGTSRRRGGAGRGEACSWSYDTGVRTGTRSRTMWVWMGSCGSSGTRRGGLDIRMRMRVAVWMGMCFVFAGDTLGEMTTRVPVLQRWVVLPRLSLRRAWFDSTRSARRTRATSLVSARFSRMMDGWDRRRRAYSRRTRSVRVSCQCVS
jgi:hypothetical protein